MGTRNLISVVLDGEFKVAQYGQWDGYLGGQGLKIVQFLNSPAFDLGKFKEAVRRCRWASDQEVEKLWAECGADGSGLVSFEIADIFKHRHPEYSRDTCADILQVIMDKNGCGLQNALEFVADSSCEWSYVLDLDNETFEIYWHGRYDHKLDETDRYFGIKNSDPNWQHEPPRVLWAFDFKDITPELLEDFDSTLRWDDEANSKDFILRVSE